MHLHADFRYFFIRNQAEYVFICRKQTEILICLFVFRSPLAATLS